MIKPCYVFPTLVNFSMLKWFFNKMPFQRLAIVPFSGAISKRVVDEYAVIFKFLEEAKNIKGVLIEIECPGGSATASEILFERLKRLNDRKPLYCYAVMAASGGYMTATGARRIFAPSTALIGSIGVLSIKPVLKGFMEMLGIRLEVMKKGSMKDMSLFHRESTEEEKRSWDAINEDIYERFIEIVSERRRIQKEKVKEIATGELFTAKRAKEIGLIDGISDFDSFLEELSKETGVKKEKSIIIKPKKPFLKRIAYETAVTFYDELWRQMY